MKNSIMYPKLFISPLSFNVIKAAQKIGGEYIGFILSENQVCDNSGYTGYTNQSLKQYLKELKFDVLLERDHFSCNINNIEKDAQTFDIIHIDPFKNGKMAFLEKTARILMLFYKENPNLYFEVGTEQAIYEYSSSYLNYYFLENLYNELPLEAFNKIKYVVVQAGTGLKDGKNYGETNLDKLKSMYNVCKKYGKSPKEHNSDFVSNDIIKKKSKICDNNLSINIAPEIGMVESKVIYELSSDKDKDVLYSLCVNNPNTFKWFSKDFDYNTNKQLVVESTLHYNFTHPELIKIKEKTRGINYYIRSYLGDFLREKIQCLEL